MGLQNYTQDMSKITLKYHKKVLFYTKYTHPTLICRGTHGRTDGRTENIYSVFRDKLLLRGEHVKPGKIGSRVFLAESRVFWHRFCHYRESNQNFWAG
jgi:hypothetical protein